MHIALLVDAWPATVRRVGPQTDADEAVSVRLREVASLVERRPGAPIAVAAPAEVLRELGTAHPDLLSGLKGVEEWIRSGWARPPFPVIPASSRNAHIEWETQVLSALDLTPGGLLITGPWDPQIVMVAAHQDVPYLLLDSTRAGRTTVGVVDHLGRTLPLLAVSDHVAMETQPEDALVVVRIGLDEDLEATVDALVGTPGCDLTSPGAYLREHSPAGLVIPDVEDGSWMRALSSDPAATLLYRKMIRLASRLPERTDAEALELLMAAQAERLYGPEGLSGRYTAHESLIAARRIIDERRRGDSWVHVSRRDWDADGSEDIQIETHDLSLVLDAAEGARLVYLDDKGATWPVTHVIDDDGRLPTAAVAHAETLDGAGIACHFSIASVVESRPSVALTFEAYHGDGFLSVTMVVDDHRLEITYRFEDLPVLRLGPELPLRLPACRIRVDGSEWSEVAETRALSGHRFRLANDERQVLIQSMSPADCFIRPAGTGVDRGVVVWPHLTVEGIGEHTIAVDVAP